MAEAPPMAGRQGRAFAARIKAGHGRAATLASVARDARLTRGYLLQVLLATAIAHIGLLMDSAPVIIGAMLISPLLGPIMGAGFGLAVFDGRLLRRSVQTLVAGTVLAVAVAMVLTWLSPMTDATPSILARVRPSLLDLLVAIFGGIAGAYAILRKLSTSLVGVAIATALVPPLATVGWALALGRWDDAGGATLLYVTNTAAIAFMATVVARVAGFGATLSPRQTGFQTLGILAALAVLAVPLVFSLSAIVRETRTTSALRSELSAIAGPDARIDRLDIDFRPSRPAASAVVIAPRFVPALEPRFAQAARERLGAKADVRVLQLRSGTAEAEQARAEAADLAAAQQARVREAQRLRAALSVAYDVAPEAIVIDGERRVALVTTPPDRTEADTVDLAPLRAVYADWSIDTVVGAAAPALADPANAPDQAP